MVGTASHHCGKEVLSVLLSAWKSPISWPFWDSRYDWNPWKSPSLFSDVEGLLQSQLFLGTEIFPFFFKWKGRGKEKRSARVLSLRTSPCLVGKASPPDPPWGWWCWVSPRRELWARSVPVSCKVPVQECLPSSPDPRPGSLSAAEPSAFWLLLPRAPAPVLTSQAVSASPVHLCGAVLPHPPFF